MKCPMFTIAALVGVLLKTAALPSVYAVDDKGENRSNNGQNLRRTTRMDHHRLERQQQQEPPKKVTYFILGDGKSSSSSSGKSSKKSAGRTAATARTFGISGAEGEGSQASAAGKEGEEDQSTPTLRSDDDERMEASFNLMMKQMVNAEKNNTDSKKESHDENEEVGDKNGIKRDISPRIVGGSQASPGEFPYFVDLDGCGGSLIAPNVVLTAAHCNEGYRGTSVIVGAYRNGGSTSNNAVRVTVAEDIPHPNYNEITSAFANDFRLLRLSREVTIPSNANVVLSINDEYSIPATNDDLTVMGLGATFEGSFVGASILRDVEVKAISTNTCNRPIAYDGDVEDDIMFCAGFLQGGKDSCQGDSGGPIVIRNGNQHVQVGVVSWGRGCARPNKPGVYARVSSAYPWIREVVCNQWNSQSASFCNDNTPEDDDDDDDMMMDCKRDEMEFEFTLRTDQWGSETSWEVVNDSSPGTPVASGSNYDSNRIYRIFECIPMGCYTLTLSDEYGDGFTASQVTNNNPGYELKIDGQVVESKDGGFNFGYEHSIEFGSCNNSPSCWPITLNLITDRFGHENSVILLTNKGDLLWNVYGFADSSAYHFHTCLEGLDDDGDLCATLKVLDTWGDGIQFPGYVQLTVNGIRHFQSGEIGQGVVFSIGKNC